MEQYLVSALANDEDKKKMFQYLQQQIYGSNNRPFFFSIDFRSDQYFLLKTSSVIVPNKIELRKE